MNTTVAVFFLLDVLLIALWAVVNLLTVFFEVFPSLVNVIVVALLVVLAIKQPFLTFCLILASLITEYLLPRVMAKIAVPRLKKPLTTELSTKERVELGQLMKKRLIFMDQARRRASVSALQKSQVEILDEYYYKVRSGESLTQTDVEILNTLLR